MSAAREIRAAFELHFLGEQRVYVPRVRVINAREVEVGEPARDALEGVADYPGPLAAWHAMLTGQATVEQYRAALVDCYVEAHVDELDEHRSATPVRTWIAPQGAQSPIPPFIAGAPA